MKEKSLSNTENNKNYDTNYPSNEYLNALVNNDVDVDVDDILDIIEKDLDGGSFNDDEESYEDENNENNKLFSKAKKEIEEGELMHLQETFSSNSRCLTILLIFCFALLYLLLNYNDKYDTTHKNKSGSYYISMHDYKTKYEKEADTNNIANNNNNIPCDDNGGYNDCRNIRGKVHELTPDEMSDEDLNKHIDIEYLNKLNKEEEDFFAKEDHDGDDSMDDEDFIKLLKLENLADLSEVYDPTKSPSDIPLFFHVPRAAGIVVEDIFSLCYNLVEVSQVGITNGHWADKSLEVLNLNGGKYVNIDSTTRNGIQKAKNLNLASSGLSDVIFTSYLYDASRDIFSSKIKGKCFALLRHPIERSISLYNYRKDNDPYYKTMTMNAYLNHGLKENNWMTRFLSDKETGEVYEYDLDIAKKVLKEKCLIGFLYNLEESMKRFEKYFHWNDTKNEKCFNDLIEFSENANSIHQNSISSSSEITVNVTKDLVNRNFFDLKLYDYAKNQLFQEQEVYIQ